MAWCEFYDMDSAGCGHCAGLSGPGVVEAGSTGLDEKKSSVIRIRARYTGRCTNCGEKFYIGDSIIAESGREAPSWQAVNCCGSTLVED